MLTRMVDQEWQHLINAATCPMKHHKQSDWNSSLQTVRYDQYSVALASNTQVVTTSWQSWFVGYSAGSKTEPAQQRTS
jgi:hypothetical protein